jgi:hypothetical protein
VILTAHSALYMHQNTGVLGFENGPEFNIELDSCTFASNTAGTMVSSIRTAFVSLQGAA